MSLRAAGAVFVAFWVMQTVLGPGANVFSPISPAMAQDDDDDDDNGGDDDGGDDDDDAGDDGGDDDDDAGDDGGDDDDGGGDDDDDDGGSRNPGSGGGGGSSSDDDDDDRPAVRAGDDDQRRVVRRATPVPAAPVPLKAFADGELVSVDLSPADLALLVAQGFEVLDEVPVPEVGTLVRRLRVPAGLALPAARDVVRALPSGSDADFNHYFRSEQAVEATCTAINCSSLELIGWSDATERSASLTCGSPMAIGVIDTGINPDHPTFAGKRLQVYRLSADTLEPSRAVHGTAVTAILIGDAAGRAPGLLPAAEVIAVDAFHRAGRDERADVFTLVRALDYLADRGVRVVNLSLSGPSNSALEQTIAALHADNVVLVAAAGNGGPRAEPAFPAAYAPVIAVTAVDQDGTVYRRAGQGAHIDLAAPGVNVWTAASISGEKPKTGTSFAAPFVTAAAAMILAAEPSLTPAQVEARLKAGARDLGEAGIDPVYGAGLIQMPAPCSAPAVTPATNAAGE